MSQAPNGGGFNRNSSNQQGFGFGSKPAKGGGYGNNGGGNTSGNDNDKPSSPFGNSVPKPAANNSSDNVKPTGCFSKPAQGGGNFNRGNNSDKPSQDGSSQFGGGFGAQGNPPTSSPFATSTPKPAANTTSNSNAKLHNNAFAQSQEGGGGSGGSGGGGGGGGGGGSSSRPANPFGVKLPDSKVKAGPSAPEASGESRMVAAPLRLIEKLQEVNLDKYINLPELAVMGDTSAGKSSLLSMISGVEFPKDAELTTRCPMRLSLVKRHEDKTHERHTNTNDNDAPPPAMTATITIEWKDEMWDGFAQTPSWPEDGCQVDCSTGAVTEAMRKAQHFIMHAGNKTREVAWDVVHIKIVGDFAYDLTLTDLPGFVRTTGDAESKDLGDGIKALVHSFLQNERCIIIGVSPAVVDFHNSEILHAAEQVDSRQDRTIVVVTKPDMVDEGAEQSVLNFIKGEVKAFKHLPHVVRSRGQKQLTQGVSIPEAKQLEAKFFNTKDPWNTLNKEVVGTEALQSRLSQLQKETILRRFPDIRKEVAARVAVVSKELEGFPDVGTVATRRATVRNAFVPLRDHINMITERGSALRRKITDLKDRYANDLLRLNIQREITTPIRFSTKRKLNLDHVGYYTTQPQLIERAGRGMKGFKDDEAFFTIGGKKPTEGSIIILKETGVEAQLYKRVPEVTEDESCNNTNNNDVRAPTNGFGGGGGGGGPTPPTIQYYAATLERQPQPLVLSRDEFDLKPTGKTMIDAVKDHQSRGLNAGVPESLITDLIEEFINAEVQGVTIQLVEECYTLVNKVVMECVNEHLSALLNRFDSAVCFTSGIESMLEQRKAALQTELATALRRESVPHTQNHYFTNTLRKRRTEEVRERIRLLADSNGKVNMNEIDALFDETERISNDEFLARDTAFILEAYWKVAAKRLGDSVPESVDQILTSRFGEQIYDLYEDLDDTQLGAIFEVPEHQLRRKKDLELQLKSLSDGLAVLDYFSKPRADSALLQLGPGPLSSPSGLSSSSGQSPLGALSSSKKYW